MEHAIGLPLLTCPAGNFSIGNQKLFDIFQKKYSQIWKNLYKNPDPKLIAQKWYDANAVMIEQKWHEYLKDLGLEKVCYSTSVREKPNSGEFVLDPCSKMGQSRYWPLYIVVPEEMSLKILALGELP